MDRKSKNTGSKNIDEIGTGRAKDSGGTGAGKEKDSIGTSAGKTKIQEDR